MILLKEPMIIYKHFKDWIAPEVCKFIRTEEANDKYFGLNDDDHHKVFLDFFLILNLC
jgi:hypothetical protein